MALKRNWKIENVADYHINIIKLINSSIQAMIVTGSKVHLTSNTAAKKVYFSEKFEKSQENSTKTHKPTTNKSLNSYFVSKEK